MQKIHGTFMVIPLTLTNGSVSDTAAIQEHKLDLDYGTNDLNTDITQLRSDFEAHVNTNTNPHGTILNQNIIRAPVIESQSGGSTIAVRNSNQSQSVTVSVLGDVSVSRDCSIGRDLTVTRNTVLNGTLTVNGDIVQNGTHYTANSTVTDYDVMTITPTTLTNPDALTIAPDDEGYSPTAGTSFYVGNMITGYSRRFGANVLTFVVDKDGNVKLTGGSLTFGTASNKISGDSDFTYSSHRIKAPGVTSTQTVNYQPFSDGLPSVRSFAAYNAAGNALSMYATEGGDLWSLNRLGVGGAWLTWNGSEISTSNTFHYTNAPQIFESSPVVIRTNGKTDWTIKNDNSSCDFYFGSNPAPTVSFTNNNIYLNSPSTTVKNLTVDNISFTTNGLIAGINVGSHDHSGGQMGVKVNASNVLLTASTGYTTPTVESFINQKDEIIQDVAANMFSGTHPGCSVTYDDPNGKLTVRSNGFTLNLGGSGSDLTGTIVVQQPADGAVISANIQVNDDSHNHSNLTGTTQSDWIIDSDGYGLKVRANDSSTVRLVRSDGVTSANLIVGNLTVQGTTTVTSPNQVQLGDNIITLNYGGPVQNAGIEVQESGSVTSQLLWDNTISRFTCGTTGSLSPIVREADLQNSTNTTSIRTVIGNTISVANGLNRTPSSGGSSGLTIGVNSWTLTLGGDVSGTATFSGIENKTISVTVNQAANASRLGGQLPSYYSAVGHTHDGSAIVSGIVPNSSLLGGKTEGQLRVSNADMLDDFHATSFVMRTDTATSPTANKLLYMDSNGYLPANITGNSTSVGGRYVGTANGQIPLNGQSNPNLAAQWANYAGCAYYAS